MGLKIQKVSKTKKYFKNKKHPNKKQKYPNNLKRIPNKKNDLSKFWFFGFPKHSKIPKKKEKRNLWFFDFLGSKNVKSIKSQKVFQNPKSIQKIKKYPKHSKSIPKTEEVLQGKKRERKKKKKV